MTDRWTPGRKSTRVAGTVTVLALGVLAAQVIRDPRRRTQQASSPTVVGRLVENAKTTGG
jgi:hypothetical protein